MNNKISIYLHQENQLKPEIVTVDKNTTYSKLMNELSKNDRSEIHIFRENEEMAEDKEESVHLEAKSHIHCHRCKKVQITVTYNGQAVNLTLPPSSTGEKILSKSCKELGITKDDATDLHLKNGNLVIQFKDHIGSYVSFPDCQINLNLLPNNQMQGCK